MNDYSTIVQALTKHRIRVKFRARSEHAGVAELADALRSGRSEHYARVGSNPTFGTPLLLKGLQSVQRFEDPLISDDLSPLFRASNPKKRMSRELLWDYPLPKQPGFSSQRGELTSHVTLPLYLARSGRLR
jgi:hypothetical protein